LIAKIIKIHSDFYYAEHNENIFECKIREILKKERLEIYVGDSVKLEDVNYSTNQAVITGILERDNYISRPAVANIDRIILVTALKQPDIDFVQLNRYLCLARLHNIPVVICVNKCDLSQDDILKNQTVQIYEPLGYRVIFTSALEGAGISELKDILKNNISVLCGTSGVGKSSLLNAIQPDLRLKTKDVGIKTLRGTHSTRHTEIINMAINDKETAKVADTPGFSYLRFDNILPKEVEDLFEEIKQFSAGCKYNDCLHIEESGCSVIENLDKIPASRYESYKIFVYEAQEYKNKLNTSSSKKEKRVKTIDSKKNEKIKIVKLGTQAKEFSRKNKKQKLNYISSVNDAYYNDKDRFE
jgi:ribosome biogenesis GTPase